MGQFYGRFSDDDGNTYENEINDIADDGITAGCTANRIDLYCPRNYVTRGQMAIFLVRVLGYSTLGPVSSSGFSDVPSNSVYAPYVKNLKDLGITLGYPIGG